MAAAAGGGGGFDMGRVAATNAERKGKERTLYNVFHTILPQFAANDAKHDFHRTEPPAFKFSDVFEKDKDIGTPVKPEKLQDEAHTLDTILQYLSTEGSSDSEKLKNTFLIEGDNPFTFQRFAEDEVPYKVNALHVATTGADKQRIWKAGVTSKQLFEFLNPHGQTSIAFAIDSQSVPFYELLSRDKKGGENSREAFFIKSREELNDSASKITFKEPDVTNFVQIKTVEDKPNTDIRNAAITYKAAIWDGKRILNERELFYSKYNINISPIKYSHGLLPLTTLEFSERKFIRTVDVLRATKENSHPNAITTVIKQLNALFKERGGIKTVANKLTYQTLLQQKRSGDWLQVLSCLDSERYSDTLEKGTRIFLVTHDRICLAYALLMGIDVCFTVHREDMAVNKESWLVFFYKNINIQAISPSQRLFNKIATLPRPGDIGLHLGLPRDAGFTYESARDEYIKARNDTIDFYRREIDVLLNYDMNELFRRGSAALSDMINNHIRSIIKSAVNLAVVRNTAPKLVKDAGELDIFRYSLDDIENMIRGGGGGGGGVGAVAAGDNIAIKNILKKIDIYINQFMILKQSIFATETKALNYENAIALFFNKIKNKNKSKPFEQRAVIIDKIIAIKSRRYEPGQPINVQASIKASKIDGMGVFNFLFQLLEDAEINDIIKHFNSILARINVTSPQYNDFNTFLKIAKLELGIPITEDVEVSNGELIGVIQSIGGDNAADFAARVAAGVTSVDEEETGVAEGDVDASMEATEAASGAAEAADGDAAAEEVDMDEVVAEAAEAAEAADRKLVPRYAKKAQKPNRFFNSTRRGSKKAAGPLTQGERARKQRMLMLNKTRKNRAALMIEEEDNKQLQNIEDTTHITDFFASLLILAIRAKNAFNAAAAAGGGGGAAQRGGGKSPYKHNPLITFYLLLREIGFRLTQEYEENELLVQFANFIYIILDSYKIVPKDFKETYIQSAELYCLEYITQNKAFETNIEYISHVLLNFKKEYYGFYNVSDNYKKSLETNALLLEKILLLDEDKKGIVHNIQNELDILRERMNSIIHSMEESEKIATIRIQNTRRNTSKSAKVINVKAIGIKGMNGKRANVTRRIMRNTLPNINNRGAAAIAA